MEAEIERLFDGLELYSQQIFLNDQLKNVADACRDECGSCIFWMRKGCPKEKNINGISRGPSCCSPPCEKFQLNPIHAEIRIDKFAEMQAKSNQLGMTVAGVRGLPYGPSKTDHTTKG